MTLLTSSIVIMGIIAVALGAYYIWTHVPVLQCPRCESYDTEDFEIPGAFARCLSCGNEWKAE
jgi:hypothetical protein